MLTPYNDSNLREEINKAIDELEARQQTVYPAWVTHAICKEHVAGLAVDGNQKSVDEPYDVAFWRFNGYTNVRKLVTNCINEREDPLARPDNPFLPGFRYLQHSYVVERDGDFVKVPTGDLAYEELLAKADQYDRNAATLNEHANELRRYAEMRREHRRSGSDG
jgi:hypothetical protein